jgi:hypothetical protein
MAAIRMARGWSYVSFVRARCEIRSEFVAIAAMGWVCAVMALYVAANLAHLKVSIAQIAASERVAAEVATLTMG